MTVQLNRREALAGAGALVVSVALPVKPDQLATYISVNADGSATAWIGKVDMGQGTDVGWTIMVAEELDLAPDRVSIVQGHTDVTINQGGASGSTGIGRAARRCAMRRRKRAACSSRWHPSGFVCRPIE